MNGWWASQLRPEGLSQGDIVDAVPFGTMAVPLVGLSKSTGKKGVTTWTEANAGTTKNLLASGDIYAALVISHNCELDKNERKKRVLAAPVRAMDDLDEQTKAQVLAQERLSLMPLPDLPGKGDCYADLRLIQSLDRGFFVTRIASMSDAGLKRLHAQLAAFLLRLNVESLLAP